MDSLVNSIADRVANSTHLFPDSVLRFGMRRLLKSTLNMPIVPDADFANDLRTRAIAEHTKQANEQHYEVPARFFETMLGPKLKYSSGYWPNDEHSTLQESEDAMLIHMCDRAELDNPEVQSILDLGCGWGSAALFIAARYPNKRVTCVSNSVSQCDYITAQAKARGLTNLFAQTQDANQMSFPANEFDRIVTNEMFEHMKNYELFLQRIAIWLKPQGKLFIHIFTNRSRSYHFESGWMADKFFTGGMMPSHDLLPKQFCNRDFVCEQQYKINGMHYSRTLEAWLQRMDAHKEEILQVFEPVYGSKQHAKEWFQNWRLFNMACSELFKYNAGEEWFVSHYLLAKRQD